MTASTPVMLRSHHVTIAIAILFGLLGAFMASGFAAMLLKGELAAPGLTSLGYVIVLSPGVAGAACFGTVLLRLLGRPSAWLGCISIVLSTMVVFLGVIALVLAIVLPMIPVGVSIMTIAILLSIGAALLVRRAG